MDAEERAAKTRELANLRDRATELERELAQPPAHWQATSYYAAYYVTTGAFLGMIGAIASLVFNVVGSWAVQQSPLRLIQVYLTFPLGEKAISPQFESTIALVIGCCLYIGTGMLLGIPFQLALTRFAPHSSLLKRLVVATSLAIALWLFNFYAVLSWLQPLLFGGAWIIDQELLPWWVAMLTHIVFGWTMAFLYPLGEYYPYRRQTETQ